MQRPTVVVWDHEQTLDFERAVAALTADRALSQFVRGYLIQARQHALSRGRHRPVNGRRRPGHALVECRPGVLSRR